MHSVPCSLSARASARVRRVNLRCSLREKRAPCSIVRTALLLVSSATPSVESVHAAEITAKKRERHENVLFTTQRKNEARMREDDCAAVDVTAERHSCIFCHRTDAARG